MHKNFGIIIFAVCLLLSAGCWAETLHLTDGRTLTGEIVSMDDSGIILKNPDGSYGERTPWGKITQEDLKILAQNPKAAELVQAFIEPSAEEKIQRTQVEIKDVPRLTRPPKGSLLGALLTTPMGLFIFVLVYAANLYAAFEIGVFRNRPLGLVCGVSAVAPFIGPMVFLALPHHMKHKLEEQAEASWAAPIEEEIPAAAQEMAAGQAVPSEAVAEAQADGAPPPKAATSKLPPAKVFARGQFTFNRRFFETQVPGFFAMTRPTADKDKELVVKSARGTHLVHRISKISAADISLQIQKGAVSEEVVVPFVEIQEVQLKPKAA